MNPITNLNQLKEDLGQQAFGKSLSQAHAAGVCISCNQPPKFREALDVQEYRISGICPDCWDRLFEE